MPKILALCACLFCGSFVAPLWSSPRLSVWEPGAEARSAQARHLATSGTSWVLPQAEDAWGSNAAALPQLVPVGNASGAWSRGNNPSLVPDGVAPPLIEDTAAGGFARLGIWGFGAAVSKSTWAALPMAETQSRGMAAVLWEAKLSLGIQLFDELGLGLVFVYQKEERERFKGPLAERTYVAQESLSGRTGGLSLHWILAPDIQLSGRLMYAMHRTLSQVWQTSEENTPEGFQPAVASLGGHMGLGRWGTDAQSTTWPWDTHLLGAVDIVSFTEARGDALWHPLGLARQPNAFLFTQIDSGPNTTPLHSYTTDTLFIPRLGFETLAWSESWGGLRIQSGTWWEPAWKEGMSSRFHLTAGLSPWVLASASVGDQPALQAALSVGADVTGDSHTWAVGLHFNWEVPTKQNTSPTGNAFGN